jgi:hypothetical protein
MDQYYIIQSSVIAIQHNSTGIYDLLFIKCFCTYISEGGVTENKPHSPPHKQRKTYNKFEI